MKTYKPITPSLRHKITIDRFQLSNKNPIKSLTTRLKKNSGRNVSGKITVYRRGGGNNTNYRKIDFNMNICNIPYKIKSMEYDPNRTNFINKINFLNLVDRYVPSYLNTKNNITNINILNNNYNKNDIYLSEGNTFKLKNIPISTKICNISLYPNKRSQIAKAAGTYATLLSHNNKTNYTLIKLSSGETRLIYSECHATIGINGNIDKNKINLGKAGASRWIGRRPSVRGVAMNPVDHPHGGGEGKTSGGRPSVTPWGKITKGKKTRSKKKINKLIIKNK